MAYIIVTNNSKLNTDVVEIQRVEGLFEDVLNEVRRLVHIGYRLEIAPLPASHRMLLSPVRSIILSKGDKPNQESMLLMEKDLMKYQITMGQRKPDLRNLSDYELLDKDLTISALEDLGIRG